MSLGTDHPLDILVHQDLVRELDIADLILSHSPVCDHDDVITLWTCPRDVIEKEVQSGALVNETGREGGVVA